MSDICSAFAVNLSMECELFAVRLFGTNCQFAILEGICDANGGFKYGLTVEFESVNCGSNGNKFLQCSDCYATGLVLNCGLSFNDVGICVVINWFEW